MRSLAPLLGIAVAGYGLSAARSPTDWSVALWTLAWVGLWLVWRLVPARSASVYRHPGGAWIIGTAAGLTAAQMDLALAFEPAGSTVPGTIAAEVAASTLLGGVLIAWRRRALSEGDGRRTGPVLVLLGVAILVALGLFGSGPTGSTARVNLGFPGWLIVQPLALAGLLLVIGAAHAQARDTGLLWRFGRVTIPAPTTWLLPMLAAAGVTACGVVLNDYGSVLVSGLATAFLAVVVLRRATAAIALVGALVLGVRAAIALDLDLGAKIGGRVAMAASPMANSVLGGDQVGRYLWALAAGGLSGTNLPVHPADVHLPWTDGVFAIWGETHGALGIFALLLAIATIAHAGV